MLFSGRRVADLRPLDIEGLLDTVNEGAGVDFKLAVATDDKARHEFGADLISFANTEGGYMFIGVDEVEGIASAVTGIDVQDLDAELARLENLARDAIDPRLPSLDI